MRLPWISREAHLAITQLLTLQLAGQAAELRALAEARQRLDEERRLLLDRLATLGLGGPLFPGAGAPGAPATDDADEDKEADKEADELEQLLRLRRRPSQLAGVLTRRARREAQKTAMGSQAMGPRVAWVPAGPAAPTALEQLQQAEAAAGKKA